MMTAHNDPVTSANVRALTTSTIPTEGAQGKTVARVAFALGIAVSIAANVAHTWHPSAAILAAAAQRGIPADQWRPELGAQLSAAFYPLALLLTVEIVTRVAWRPGWRFALARFGGVGAVALVAAVVSYRHMTALLAAYGEDPLTAAIGPFAVDGLMIVASVALASISKTSPPVPHAEPPAVPIPVTVAPTEQPTAPRTAKTSTARAKTPARKPTAPRTDAELLDLARAADAAHRAANNGRPISFENLGKALKVAKPLANDLGKAVRAEAEQRPADDSADRVLIPLTLAGSTR